MELSIILFINIHNLFRELTMLRILLLLLLVLATKYVIKILIKYNY